MMTIRSETVAAFVFLSLGLARGFEREESLSNNRSLGSQKSSLDEGPSGPGTLAANHFVDAILNNLAKFDAQISPSQLGNLTKEGVHLTNISLTGISDAFRYGNAQPNISEDSLHIITTLGLPKLGFRGQYGYKLPWPLPHVNGNFRLALKSVVLLVNVRMSTGDGARLHQLQVADVHSIRFDELSGFSPFNWALRYLLEAIVRLNEEEIIHTVQQQTRGYLLNATAKTSGAINALNDIVKEMIDAEAEVN